MNPDEVRFRLIRDNDIPPTNPHNLEFHFGLQDTKQVIDPPERQPNGTLAFDFSLTVKKGKDVKRPVFTGRFASGPVNDRFIYLSWYSVRLGAYINRVKARLSNIDWKMVRQSQEKNKAITADMTGWVPGDKRKNISWYLS